VNREIGRIVSEAPGATLIAVGGIHGNEHAGLHAARRVLGRLGRGDVAFTGEMVALAGNVGALGARRRFLDHDLNRVWSDAQVAAVEADGARGAASVGGEAQGATAEDREQRELLAAIRAAIARARGRVVLVDLHSTSAAGVPFVACGTGAEQRAFIADLPLPVIVGLEEKVDGALSAYWNAHGCTAFTVEGGQHDDPATIDNLSAVLLLVLEAAGMVAKDALPEASAGRGLLDGRRGDLPRMMEVVSRFAITPDQGFTMMPGFRNLDFARRSQLLARDKNGEIRANSDGLVILPLYQGQGNDGFFWGRELAAHE
jgi:succinylglutamate desuccinylase